MKRKGPQLLTTVLAVVLLLSTVTSVGRAIDLPGRMDNFYVLVTAGAFLMGAIGLTRLHVGNIIGRKKDWIHSIVLVGSLWGYFIYGLFVTCTHPFYQKIYNTTVIQARSSILGLLSFYIASSAYRAFRARNVDGAILLVVGALVMMANIPLGELISPAFPAIGDWIISIPTSAMQRGLQLCIGIGGLAVALRILLMLETAHLGQDLE